MKSVPVTGVNGATGGSYNVLLKILSYCKPLDLKQLKQTFLYSPQCLQQWPLDLHILTQQKKSSVQMWSHMYRRKEEGRCIRTPLKTNTHERHVAHFHANSFLSHMLNFPSFTQVSPNPLIRNCWLSIPWSIVLYTVFPNNAYKWKNFAVRKI